MAGDEEGEDDGEEEDGRRLHLINILADHLWRQPRRLLFQDFEEILFDVFEDKVEFSFPSERLAQLHNVFMFQHAKDLHLQPRRNYLCEN